MFSFIKRPYIGQPGNLTGRALNNSRLVKGDTILVKARIGGDTTGAVVSLTGRLLDDSLKTVIFQKTSATPSEVQIDVVCPGLFSDVTVHVSSADTAALDPDTRIEYDFQIVDDVSYGGSSGGDITIANATSTLEIGQFTVIDQVTI